MKLFKTLLLPVLAIGVIAGSCSTQSKTAKGAVIGTAGGAVVGAVIGKATGNTARGAIIGAVLGGAGGAIIGRKMDKQAEEMRRVLGDSAVRREGEGIIVNFSDKVLFATNESALSESAKASLDKLAKILVDYPDTEINIIGHTDSQGADDYNQTLSQRRAEAVSDYLVTRNVAGDRLKKIGKGENDPIADNGTEEGRAQNRRVEFVIIANEKMKAEAKKESGN